MSVERATPGALDWAELSAPHLARYLVAAEFAPGRRVLDAGSGAGYGASLLKAAGALSVLGVDLDAAAVSNAQEEFGSASVSFIVDDCQELSAVNGPFDLICSFEAIEHFAEPRKFLGRAAALLGENGVLLVSTPDRASSPPFVNGRPRNPFHVHEWYRTEFEQLLKRYFSEVDLRVQVESPALRSRKTAVRALRRGLMWSNPLATLIWRKSPWVRKRDRSWTKLAGLAAPTIADYPVVQSVLAPAYGTPCFSFGICRKPIAP